MKLSSFLILISPLFILIFIEKTIDFVSYRRLLAGKDQSKQITKIYLSTICSLVVSCLVVPFIELYFIASNYDLFSIIYYVGVLLYAEWLVLKFFFKERTVVNSALQGKSITKWSLVTNLIITGVYRMLYSCFFIWWLEMSWNSGEEITGNGHYKADFKWTIIYWVGYLMPILVFALIKAIIQFSICKKLSKKQIEV